MGVFEIFGKVLDLGRPAILALTLADANILLAIAYVRDHDKKHARELLASLRDEFPANPLFAQEIAKLDAVH